MRTTNELVAGIKFEQCAEKQHIKYKKLLKDSLFCALVYVASISLSLQYNIT